MNIKENFQNLYRRITSSGFLKSVLTLSSGVVVGQAINFFGMPVVGRIYSPAAIGDYTLITSNAAVIMSVACLGMMTVFMLPEKDEEARGLSRLVTYSTLLITTLAVLGLQLFSGFYRIFQTDGIPYGAALLVLWLYVVFYTISNICYAHVNRQKLYRVMFWNPIIAAGVNVLLGVVFGLLGWGFVGYTAAHILSFLANILHLIRRANPYARVENPAYRCLPLLKSYRRFPLFQMPANLLNSMAQQLPVQMLGSLFSSGVLGLYSMAVKILSLPTSLLAIPINRVYYQEASQRYNRGEDIGEFSFKILEANIKIAILPITLLTLFGEWIFAIFLGERWREAGTYAAILGIYYLVMFCNNCLAGGFVIIGRNKINLYCALYSLISNALLYVIIALWGSDVFLCLVLLCAFGIFGIFLSQGIFLKLVGFPMVQYGGFLLKYIFLPMGLVWGLRLLFW